MLQSKLITLFRGFNREELKRFEAFLLSPYFNQSEMLIKFFRLIERHHPSFDSKKLAKEKLYKSLYGDGSYNDTNMRKLVSEMFKQAKTFSAHEKLRNNNLDASLQKYEWLMDHGVKKVAEAELEVHGLLLDACAKHDNAYYYHRRRHDLLKFEIATERFRGSEHKLLKDFDIFSHIHSLNRDYVVNSFSLHIYLLTLHKIYNLPLNEAILQPLETLTHSYVNKGDAVIDLFFNVFQLVRTNDEKYFFELMARFFENSSTVPIQLLWETGVALENYCIKKIREGDERFSAAVMQIYRFEVENNLHLNHGKLSFVYYHNVAVRGAESSELDWTEYFVENNKKYLSEESKEDAYNYSLAHILFARKNYRDALRLALSSNIPFFASKILIKNLVARAHYELGMLDELQIELDTYRHHLKDERISDERRQHFQAFINTMRQLAELKGNHNQEKLMDLYNQVEAQKGLANRKWFQEKIKELQESPFKRNQERSKSIILHGSSWPQIFGRK